MQPAVDPLSTTLSALASEGTKGAIVLTAVNALIQKLPPLDMVDGMSFATEGEIPVLAGPEFTIYSGGNFLAKTLENVWAGRTKIDEAMARLQETWQRGLDEG